MAPKAGKNPMVSERDAGDFAAKIDKGQSLQGKTYAPTKSNIAEFPGAYDVTRPKNVPGKQYGEGMTGYYGDWGRMGTLSGMKPIASRKHGGPIRKTGLYKLHAGEKVVARKSKGKK